MVLGGDFDVHELVFHGARAIEDALANRIAREDS